MIIIPVIYPSAAWFWIHNDFIHTRKELLPGSRELVSLPSRYNLPKDPKLIQRIQAELQLPAPLKLLAPTSADRRETKWISCCARPSVLPTKSFVELYPGSADSGYRLLMASPELCFLQAAAGCSFLETVKLGYDLCSIYQPDHNAKYGQIPRTPPVNTVLLQKFVEKAVGMYGIQNARKAVQYVLDRSNSPMETRLAIIQHLPFSNGGFSIGGQELNSVIEFSAKAAELFRRDRCSCDTVWHNAKVVLEYDSNQTHLSTDQHDWDKRKTAALRT